MRSGWTCSRPILSRDLRRPPGDDDACGRPSAQTTSGELTFAPVPARLRPLAVQALGQIRWRVDCGPGCLHPRTGRDPADRLPGHRGPVLGTRGGPRCHRGVAPDATGGGPLCHRGWPPLPHHQELFQEFSGNFTSTSEAAPAGRGKFSPGSAIRPVVSVPPGRVGPNTAHVPQQPTQVGPGSRLDCLARQVRAGTVPDPAWSASAYRVHGLHRAADPGDPRFDLPEPVRSRARSWRPAPVQQDDVQVAAATRWTTDPSRAGRSRPQT